MYKRHNGQISLFDEPEFFGTIPLNPKNEWVRLGTMIPWTEFEERYAENFKSATGQSAISGWNGTCICTNQTAVQDFR